MSPKTGRPKIENPKLKRLNIRLSDESFNDLELCSEKMNISKTKVVEIGIQKVKSELK